MKRSGVAPRLTVPHAARRKTAKGATAGSNTMKVRKPTCTHATRYKIVETFAQLSRLSIDVTCRTLVNLHELYLFHTDASAHAHAHMNIEA